MSPACLEHFHDGCSVELVLALRNNNVGGFEQFCDGNFLSIVRSFRWKVDQTLR